jgi:hypothetical protein
MQILLEREAGYLRALENLRQAGVDVPPEVQGSRE